MASLTINPPLLNSANPWCTTLEQLQELYDSPYTGAVTTRTSLLNGFSHDPSHHQFAFYNPTSLSTSKPNVDQGAAPDQTGSLNTLGYSPLPLKEYLGFIKTISAGLHEDAQHLKPFIISVSGSVEDVVECYQLITSHQTHVRMLLAMEVNLSCPNVPGKPPPAYSSTALLTYFNALKTEIVAEGHTHVPIGIKTPPYTYHDQFQSLIDALLKSAEAEPTHISCPISFITATNTLGSSLLLNSSVGDLDPVFQHTLNSATGTGIGGLAGAPLHPLALGNVYTIQGMLKQHEELQGIQIIGVGGVEDTEGFKRMRGVGASAVGVGTALGRKGVRVFEEIVTGEGGKV
jgi:dihydroorotate dehydrogenase (fumarate)